MYNINDILASGLFGSLLTLIIKILWDSRNASIAYKRELRKQVFQRKTEVVERAMSWYQEIVSMYSIFQVAAKEYDGSANPVTMGKIQYAGFQLSKMVQETSTKLNSIYLYYDFSDIEKEYNVAKSGQVINEAFVLIGQIQQYMAPIPITDEKELEIRRLWFNKLKQALDIAATAMDNQISAIGEIQNLLRTEYRKYMEGD